MSIFHKARFLLVSTTLVTALQAQGVNSEPETALPQPQKETTGHLLALQDGLMVKIAEHLSAKDVAALSSTNKQIQHAVDPILAEYLMTQAKLHVARAYELKN